MTFLYPDGPLPFCPYVLSSSEFSAWNSTNRDAWLSLSSIEDVVRLYWSARKIKATVENLSSDFFVTLRTATWDGSFWGPPFGPDINIDFPESESDYEGVRRKSESSDEDKAIIPTDAYHYVCETSPYFLLETTASTVGPFVNTIQLFLFLPSIPEGIEITGQKLILNPATGIYYVPISFIWRVEIDPAIYPEATSPPPPDPKYLRFGGLREYTFWFRSDQETINTIEPIANFQIMGGTATMKCLNSVSGPLAPNQVFSVTLDPNDNDFFYP